MTCLVHREEQTNSFQTRLISQGKTTGRWILLDFGDIICHVMHEEDRVFYDIERLWKDCPVISLEAIKVPQEM